MPDKSKVWAQMAKDLEMVMAAVAQGLSWRKIDGPNPESTAVTADAPTFKIMCVSWDNEGETCYNGVATIMSPYICIINLPPELAQKVWEKAVSSFN